MLKALFTNKYLYIIFFSFFVLGIITLLTLDKLVMPYYTKYNESITVPDVTRISLEEAETLLTSMGLRFEVAHRRADSAFPANYVIDQTPSASILVKPNRKIYLTVNASVKPKGIVPNVVDLSLRNAQVQLQNYGFQIGAISYESSRFKNTVLRQSINEGAVVDRGISIDLVVSDGFGDKIVTIPPILGLRLPDAQFILREAGLRVGEIRFQPIEKIPPNTVLDFSPKVSSLVEGESLTLILSERFSVEEEIESGVILTDSTGINNSTPTKQDN